MDHPEPYTHSFIVKIWQEEKGTEAQGATWRGHITHVPSGERRYLKALDEIPAFIATYLRAMGVKPSRLSRLTRRIKTWWRAQRSSTKEDLSSKKP